MTQTIEQEFTNIDLGDGRLDHRALRVLDDLAADPAASINAACGGWNETLAAYRLFDNDKVEPEKVLEPHQQATKERIAQEDVVLAIQDTTELDYTNHPTHDAGLLDQTNRFGFYDHSQIAFTPQRLCLGVLNVELFNRTPESLGKSKERKGDPIETKESFRWLQGYRQACTLQGEIPDTQIISVADSECDIYDIFLEADQQETPADFVIRSKQNRSIPEKDPHGGRDTYLKVRQEVASSKVRVTRRIELPQTPKRARRDATLEIRAMEVCVKPPHARSHLDEVTYNVVLVEEVDAPDDGTAVQWLLLTTLPIETVKEVLLVVDYYVARWPIEVFFRVFKSGCRVEEIQLETNARLANCLMFYKVIAWRIMYLTFLGRECPELPCDHMFADAEWKPVWRIVTKEALPEQAPTLKAFIPILAELGGYNRRRTEGPPGAQAIWVGIRRMTDFALAWTTFGPDA